MDKKIIQIIPCQTGTKVMYEAKNEDGTLAYAMSESGQILHDDNGQPIYAADTTEVHCLALVEETDGSRYVEPVISMGEYMDVAESYIAVYVEEG